MSRMTHEEYFSRMAQLVAARSTCLRRAVGCVLVDHRHHVLSTGYNGVAAGQPHCNEVSYKKHALGEYLHACKGANLPSGQGLDLCEAIHAEQNALLQCHDVYSIETCYCTAFPCITCTKLLLNTTCTRIVYIELYAHIEQALKLWIGNTNERSVHQVKLEEPA